MNLLFISEYYPPKIMGGGELNLATTAEALAKKGINVSVLTSHHPGLPRLEVINGVKVYRRLTTGKEPSGPANNLKRSLFLPRSIVREVKKLNRKINLDLLHFIGMSIIAAPKLKQLKKPLFATIESYPTLCPKGDRFYLGCRECKFRCSFIRFLRCQFHSKEIGKTKNEWYLKYNPLSLIYIYNFYRKLNCSLKYCHLIAISQYVQKLLLQQGLQSTVIPNAMDLEMFKTKQKVKTKQKAGGKKHKTDSPKIKILYLGSLTKFKGPHILLEAARGLNCRLDFYGEGVMEELLRKKIKEYQLDAEIHQNVPYEKVPEIYAQSDLVVFPSLWPEPFGRIPLEAAAAGRPVLGSDIAAIKETIPDGRFLVEAGNISALHQAIKSFLEKPGKTEQKKMDEFLNKNYAREMAIKKIIGLYDEALGYKRN